MTKQERIDLLLTSAERNLIEAWRLAGQMDRCRDPISWAQKCLTELREEIKEAKG